MVSPENIHHYSRTSIYSCWYSDERNKGKTKYGVIIGCLAYGNWFYYLSQTFLDFFSILRHFDFLKGKLFMVFKIDLSNRTLKFSHSWCTEFQKCLFVRRTAIVLNLCNEITTGVFLCYLHYGNIMNTIENNKITMNNYMPDKLNNFVNTEFCTNALRAMYRKVNLFDLLNAQQTRQIYKW